MRGKRPQAFRFSITGARQKRNGSYRVDFLLLLLLLLWEPSRWAAEEDAAPPFSPLPSSREPARLLLLRLMQASEMSAEGEG